MGPGGVQKPTPKPRVPGAEPTFDLNTIIQQLFLMEQLGMLNAGSLLPPSLMQQMQGNQGFLGQPFGAFGPAFQAYPGVSPRIGGLG